MPKQEVLPAVRGEAFPVDRDFPQLEIASDPRRMLEIFRTHLEPVAGRPWVIEDCIPFRFRCRQSTSRCVLQYTLRVADPDSGRRWEQWATGLLYAQAGEAERLWRELVDGDPRRGVPEPWLTFEPVGFIPDLQMVVEIFPFDRKLPNLSAVLGGALRRLDDALLYRLGPGAWRAEEHVLEPTRYRTELGAALRYTLRAREAATSRAETLRSYLKVYRNEHGGETFRLLRYLEEREEQGRNGFSVVRPISYRGEHRTLVLEEAPGTSVQELLLQGRDPSEVLRPVARAVAAFNRGHLEIATLNGLEDQLAEVRRASSLVRWACPGARAEVEAITAAVVAGLEEAPPAPIHRDLKTDHVFLSGERVVFIDLDSVVMGDPVRDPAHLFAHLTARVGLDSLPRDRARAAAGVFADEYFAHVPGPWRRSFPLHCAGALIEVAGGIFKRQEPCWPEKVGVAIEEARCCLG